MDDCLWRDSESQTAIKLPSIHPKIPLLRTTEPQGPFSYIVDSVGSSWIAFSCGVSRSDYESAALPLSYLGSYFDNSIRAKFLSIEAQNPRSNVAWRYFEKGYIAQPMPTPMSRNRKNDHRMYLTRSLVRRRLRNPNATEISSANSAMD